MLTAEERGVIAEARAGIVMVGFRIMIPEETIAILLATSRGQGDDRGAVRFRSLCHGYVAARSDLQQH